MLNVYEKDTSLPDAKKPARLCLIGFVTRIGLPAAIQELRRNVVPRSSSFVTFALLGYLRGPYPSAPRSLPAPVFCICPLHRASSRRYQTQKTPTIVGALVTQSGIFSNQLREDLKRLHSFKSLIPSNMQTI
jgi:hypothetical protein